MIEKIKAEVRRLMNNRDSRLVDGSYYDFEHLLSFIESLEKEPRDCGKGIHKQEYTGCDMSWMEESQRLDEAAGEYMEHIPESEPELMDSFYDWEQMEAAFKAGAKWIAKQGFTMGATFRIFDDENPFVNFDDHNGSKKQSMELFNDGDKVIVQIRKK